MTNDDQLLPQVKAVISEIQCEVILARLGGGTFPEIAQLLDLSTNHAQFLVRQAVKAGVITAEEVRTKPLGSGSKLRRSPERDAQAMRLLMANCHIDERGCWHWTGWKMPNGYGSMLYGGQQAVRVHRMMFVLHTGSEPSAGQCVLHSCDVRDCFNPDHLRAGTQRENMQEKNERGRNFFLNKTHCIRGHELAGENLIRQTLAEGKHRRVCRACQKITHARPEYIAWRREYQRNRRRKVAA